MISVEDDQPIRLLPEEEEEVKDEEVKEEVRSGCKIL